MKFWEFDDVGIRLGIKVSVQCPLVDIRLKASFAACPLSICIVSSDRDTKLMPTWEAPLKPSRVSHAKESIYLMGVAAW